MNGQPHGTVGGALYRMRHACRQEEIIAGRERPGLSGDSDDGFACNEYHPFVVRLNVFTRSDGRRTDDSFNDKVLMSEERIEALSFLRRLYIGEEVVGWHTSTRLALNGTATRRVAVRRRGNKPGLVILTICGIVLPFPKLVNGISISVCPEGHC